jgi:hypothetical protein
LNKIKKIKTFSLDEKCIEKLNEIAIKTKRNLSLVLEVLIEDEYTKIKTNENSKL